MATDFKTIEIGTLTRVVADTKRAKLRISIIDGVPAESCTINNWSAICFIAKLQAEGFTFREGK